MPISAPPTIPQITDPSTFATRAQDWVVWQAEQLYPALVDESTLLGLSTTSISSTSNTIGTGAKSFTVGTGKGFVAGQSLSIAYTTVPTNRMFALVTSYNTITGALVVNVQAVEGSGTYTAWSIALAFNAVLTLVQIPDGLLTHAKLSIGAPFWLSNGYLGINTGNPLAELHVIGTEPNLRLQSNTRVYSIGSSNAGGRFYVFDTTAGLERLKIDTSGQMFTPYAGSNTLSATYGCRAWGNFNGIGTVALRASGNTSSITDNGPGDYTINFATSMPDANYSAAVTAGRGAGDAQGNIVNITDGQTASSFRILIRNRSDTQIDQAQITYAIFR